MTKDLVLSMLRNADGFVSGEAIGEKLGISRAAVGNAVRALRESGYEIEAVTKRGFRLVDAPDVLRPGELMAFLDRERMKRITMVESVDSTNRLLAQMALEGAPDGTVVIADRQTAGRGRLSRPFHSPAGLGIYFSYLIRPDTASSSGERDADRPAGFTKVTSMTAVAVSDAVEAVCGRRPQIKWVNDLYLMPEGGQEGIGRKICGILTQMDLEPDSGHVRSLIIGIGVNVLEEEKDFPAELRALAGSILTTTGQRVRRAHLAAKMTQAMDEMRQALPDPEGHYLARYRAASLLPGKTVTVISGENKREAEVLCVEEDFALRVRYADGTQESLRGGEVSIRPA